MSKEKDKDKNKKEKKSAEEEQAPKVFVPYVMKKSSASAEEEEDRVPLWLITFTDIMALMLTFFVLLYSMSAPDQEQWEKMTDAISEGFSKFYSPENYSGPQDTIEIEKIGMSQALNLDYLKSVVTQAMAEDEKLARLVIIPQRDRLIISLPHDLLFEVGKAEVSVEGKQVLFSLSSLLERIRNRMEVIGHADPQPIQDPAGEFASNWELSLARAANVAAVLESVGYSRPITVRGLSSARYDELKGDFPEQELLAYARRVDIVIMKDDGSKRLFLEMGGMN